MPPEYVEKQPSLEDVFLALVGETEPPERSEASEGEPS